MWARGLKQNELTSVKLYLASRPVWARGLKQVYHNNDLEEIYVAPRVGAWIETQATFVGERLRASRAPCGRVD